MVGQVCCKEHEQLKRLMRYQESLMPKAWTCFAPIEIGEPEKMMAHLWQNVRTTARLLGYHHLLRFHVPLVAREADASPAHEKTLTVDPVYPCIWFTMTQASTGVHTHNLVCARTIRGTPIRSGFFLIQTRSHREWSCILQVFPECPFAHHSVRLLRKIGI